MNRTESNNHNHSPFRYFHNPYKYHAYSKERQECDVCHQNFSGYEVKGLYGAEAICDEINFICEKCLTEGKLRSLGCSTNSGNPTILRQQLENSLRLIKPFPRLSDEEIKKLVKEKTEEIEYRTPRIYSFKSFNWPVHCGDYCCFIGEMGKEELNILSSNKNGRAFLDEILFERDILIDPHYFKTGITKKRLDQVYKEAEEYLNWLWEYIPEHAPRKKTDPVSCLLLFQCLHCNQYLAILDLD